MRCPNRRPLSRAAFTLVELLVVIAIIMILISLTMGAIFRVQARAYEVRNRHEIGLLDTAVQTFQTEYGVNYLPSQIRLRVGGYANPADALDTTSATFLAQMWPRIQYPVNWGVPDGTVLQGQHCLVFFLGGIQNGTSCLGFGTNSSNPSDFTAGKKSPLFEFNAGRLRVDTNGALIYMDSYNQKPYAYFSPGAMVGGYNAGDCSGLSVAPYKDLSGNWLKPNSCQIISAGADGVFGPGGVNWGPGSPVLNPPSTGKGGADDQTNFSDRTLARP
jgi:type II secretory pathway pseudopilin PulG